jgi:hypothetical protein
MYVVRRRKDDVMSEGQGEDMDSQARQGHGYGYGYSVWVWVLEGVVEDGEGARVKVVMRGSVGN